MLSTQSVRKVVYAESKDLLYFVMARVINREIGIDCNKTSVRLRTLTMRPVAPRRAGAQLRRDAGGGNMWAVSTLVTAWQSPSTQVRLNRTKWSMSMNDVVIYKIYHFYLSKTQWHTTCFLHELYVVCSYVVISWVRSAKQSPRLSNSRKTSAQILMTPTVLYRSQFSPVS